MIKGIINVFNFKIGFSLLLFSMAGPVTAQMEIVDLYLRAGMMWSTLARGERAADRQFLNRFIALESSGAAV
ncbi:hypothetical protein PY730_27900 (plasmid) [Klebsiella pneumoniae]|nr:hypothetical protein PY730_27900 [Klebsiella pneumoniae]